MFLYGLRDYNLEMSLDDSFPVSSDRAAVKKIGR